MIPNNSALKAESIGQIFADDPNITLPRLPRILPEIQVIPQGVSGLLFVGTSEPQLIKGRSVRTTLPKILEKLNGKRTMEDLALELPFLSRKSLVNVVSLLYSCGLLEDGNTPPPPARFKDVDAFAGRFIDVTRLNRNRSDVLKRLYNTRLAITGSGIASHLLKECLDGCGIGFVSCYDQSDEQQEDINFLVGIASNEQDDLSQVFEKTQSRGITGYHVRLAKEIIQFGPLFIPGISSCYDCMRRIHGIPIGDGEPEELAFYVSFAAMMVLQTITRLATIHTYNGIHEYSKTKHGLKSKLRHTARLPGCKRCGIKNGRPLDLNNPALTAWLFHSSISMPPRFLLNRRKHQNHYNLTNIALTQSRDEPYYGLPTFPLPPARISRNASSRHENSSNRLVGVDDLAMILWAASGYQEDVPGSHRRIAPTGGGLESPELFAIVVSLENLHTGIYHYNGLNHSLEKTNDVFSENLLKCALGITSAQLPACIVIGMGNIGRVHTKYGSFSYRILGQDAGIAISYLIDVSSLLNIKVEEFRNMQDAMLGEICAVPIGDRKYIPTFAIGLGTERSSFSINRNLSGDNQLLRTVIDASGLPLNEYSTSLNSSKRQLKIPYAIPDARDYEVAVLRRRSIRSYRDQGIPPTTMKQICAQGIDIVRQRIDAGGPEHMIGIWVAISKPGDGLTQGFYTFQPEDCELVLRREGCTQEELRQCFIQESSGASPAAIFITGNFEQALKDRGMRGYRELLSQGGLATGRILVSVTTLGLAACPMGGFIEEGFRRFAGNDGYQEGVIMAITLGYSDGA